MSGSAPPDPRRSRPSPGLPGRCALFVPTLVFGAWTAAGAAQGGGFDGETFAAIVAMVMVTTLATPPLLRAAFPRSAGGRAEAPEATG